MEVVKIIVRINSPVLVPFGQDVGVIKFLSDLDKEIYIAPQYKFWGMFSELVVNNLPTKYTLDYIKERINEDFSGIVRKSKYYSLFSYLFNPTTADTMDKLYQIELDENHKTILGIILSRALEQHSDDQKLFKKPIIGKGELDYILKNVRDYMPRTDIKILNVKYIKEDLINQKFGTIFDNIYRKARLYSPHYLGFISLFTNKKEKALKWDERLNHIAKNNLIHGGNLIIRESPREYKEKIHRILKKQKFETVASFVWRKPDITVTKINRGIKRWNI
jgi:hypothetical protein